jgi:hypothetical protein
MGDRAIVFALYLICALIGVAVLATHSVLPTMEKAYLATAVVVGVIGALVLVARLTSRQAARPVGAQPDP